MLFFKLCDNFFLASRTFSILLSGGLITRRLCFGVKGCFLFFPGDFRILLLFSCILIKAGNVQNARSCCGKKFWGWGLLFSVSLFMVTITRGFALCFLSNPWAQNFYKTRWLLVFENAHSWLRKQNSPGWIYYFSIYLGGFLFDVWGWVDTLH